MVMRREIGGQRFADPIRHPVEPVPSSGEPNAALIAAINALSGKINALGSYSGNGASLCIPSNGQMVQFETISLLETNTNKEITVAACATYCQVFCDGLMEGITLKIRDQSAVPIDLGKFSAFPLAPETNKVWLTSDARAGRSYIVLAFSVGAPIQGFVSHPELHELAARIGGISNFDRRGEVIFQDDFSAPTLRWDTSLAAGAVPGQINLTQEHALVSPNCVKIESGGAIGASSYMARNLWTPHSPTIGIEVSLFWPTGEDESRTGIIVYVFSGTYEYMAAVSLRQSGTLADTPGIFAASTNVHSAWVPYVNSWHKVKFTFDMKKLAFGTLQYDASYISVRGVPIGRSASAVGEHVRLLIQHQTPGIATNRTVFVGHVILTENEPQALVGAGSSAPTGGPVFKTGGQ